MPSTVYSFFSDDDDCGWQVCADPTVYLLDTPGVMVPKIASVEMGLKLALAATLKDHLVGEVDIADYLLYKWVIKKNILFCFYCLSTVLLLLHNFLFHIILRLVMDCLVAK